MLSVSIFISRRLHRLTEVATRHEGYNATRCVWISTLRAPQALRTAQQRHVIRNDSLSLQSSSSVFDPMNNLHFRYERPFVVQLRGSKKSAKKAARKKATAAADMDDESTHEKASSQEHEHELELGLIHHDEEHAEKEEEEEEEEEEVGLLPDPDRAKERMDKILHSFTEYLKHLRGSEPTPELFDGVTVKAYGAQTNLKTVAQVVISSPTLAYANCFDPALAKDVCNALRIKMELNPSVEEGGSVKIPLPRVSLETRQKNAKVLGKRTEVYRHRLRRIRRSYLDRVKQGVTGKLEHVSKDDAFRVQKNIEKIADDSLHKLNELSQEKHDDIMAV